jgi:hypothetical protein
MKTSDLIQIAVACAVVFGVIMVVKALFWYAVLIGGGYVAYKLLASGSNKQINR